MNSKLFAVGVIVVLLFSSAFLMISDDADADSTFEITDGTGKVFKYDGPTEHIVTMGLGVTLTVADLGQIDKIVAVDKYCTYSYTGNEKLAKISDDMSLGTTYSASNNDYIVTTLAQMVEDKKMSLDDTIVLTAYSNNTVLRGLLEGAGFTHVLIYMSITEYADTVEFVKSMSMITTGGVSKVVADMEAVQKTINDGLKDVKTEAKGLYVRYSSSSGFTVGNTGSLAVSLITSAGGKNIAYDPEKGSTYGDQSLIVSLLSDNKDTVIFLDNGYLKDHSVEDFRNDVLGGDDSFLIVPLKSVWNNYCPDAAEGLWTFACSLYPNIFEGDIPTDDRGTTQDNTLIYVGVAAVVIILVIVGYYFFMVKK